MASNPPLRFIRLADVESRVGLKKTAIYRMVAADQFPHPISIGTASRWIEAEVDDWMRSKVVQRDKKPA